VIGYVVLFDVAQDGIRQADGLRWSDFFEAAIRAMAIRYAPLWNQGLLEGAWFVRFDSRLPAGQRLVDPTKTSLDGQRFVYSLLCELQRREPAIEFTKELQCRDMPGSGKLDAEAGDK
jgi:hypothetical protein